MTYIVMIIEDGICIKDYETELVPQIGDMVAITPNHAVNITKRLLSVENNTVILFTNEEK